jgi:hypothetical protein
MNIENDPTARPQVPQMPSGAIDHAAIERRAHRIRGEALAEMIDVLVKCVARTWSRFSPVVREKTARTSRPTWLTPLLAMPGCYAHDTGCLGYGGRKRTEFPDGSVWSCTIIFVAD